MSEASHRDVAAPAARSASRRRQPAEVVIIAAPSWEETMPDAPSLDTEQLTQAIGFDFDRARRIAVLAAFADIAMEIARLRSLDLADVHPAVVFSPMIIGDDHA
jgi:hypothetical protein